MKRAAVGHLLMLTLAAGCARQVDLSRPPDLRLGEDVCAQCKMIISEARFAAGYYDASSQPRLFDDIGCLIRYTRAQRTVPHTVWVHDYEDDHSWIPAPDAHFVASSNLQTAMGSGIVALRSRARAQELAASVSGALHTYREQLSGIPGA